MTAPSLQSCLSRHPIIAGHPFPWARLWGSWRKWGGWRWRAPVPRRTGQDSGQPQGTGSPGHPAGEGGAHGSTLPCSGFWALLCDPWGVPVPLSPPGGCWVGDLQEQSVPLGGFEGLLPALGAPGQWSERMSRE